MSLKNKIYEDYIQSMKDRDSLKKNLLSVIKGEIQNSEKNLTYEEIYDSDVVKILTKINKSLKETLLSLEEGGDKYFEVQKEMMIISKYLPSEMSYDDIKEKITDLVGKGYNNIGLIMKEFLSDQVDRKIVLEISKELLK